MDWVTRILKWIYPSLCLHCGEETKKLRSSLCSLCSEHMEIASPLGRCQRCFQKEETHLICPECRKKTPYFHKHYTACEGFGPAKTLSQHYKQGNLSLVKALSAYMVYQYTTKEENLPDFIIPLIGSFWSKITHGEDLNGFLATHVGQLLNVPVLACLKYHWEEEGASFSLKRLPLETLSDKHVLLIGASFQRREREAAAHALRLGFAQKIHSLSFI